MYALWERATGDSEFKIAVFGPLAEPLERPCQRVPCVCKIMAKNTPLTVRISVSDLCVLSGASESCREKGSVPAGLGSLGSPSVYEFQLGHSSKDGFHRKGNRYTGKTTVFGTTWVSDNAEPVKVIFSSVVKWEYELMGSGTL